MNKNSAFKTGFRLFSIVTILLLQIILTSAQDRSIPPSSPVPSPGGGIIVDPNFVGVSAEECGNAQLDCVPATFASMFASHHDPRVLGNETEFADHLKDLMTMTDQGSYYVAHAVTAAIIILG